MKQPKGTTKSRTAKVAEKLVVVGCSGDGIEAFGSLLGELSADFPAAIVHLAAGSTLALCKTLASRARGLVVEAVDGMKMVSGTVYLAKPNLHLAVDPGRLRVVHGPSENQRRPALDVLFRSAATHYGDRAIGLVLTPNVEDGAAGLWAIKKRGGTVIVRDPKEVQVAGTIMDPLGDLKPDYVVPMLSIATLLRELVGQRSSASPEPTTDAAMEQETRVAKMKMPLDNSSALGPPSVFTCPDCHGTLWEIEEGNGLRYRCRTGHAFSTPSLRTGITKEIEEGLWVAVRALGEKSNLLRVLEAKSRERKREAEARRFAGDAEQAEATVKLLHQMIDEQKGLT